MAGDEAAVAPGGAPGALAAVPLLGPLAAALAAYLGRVGGLWRRFLPMLALFFLLSFINTVLDSLKDTLVMTARGGGAAVVPWLTVYAVLPSSVAFLVAYAVRSGAAGRPAAGAATHAACARARGASRGRRGHVRSLKLPRPVPSNAHPPPQHTQWASQRIGRAPLFTLIIGGFCAFFATFAAFLLPNADTLHLHSLADGLQQVRRECGCWR